MEKINADEAKQRYDEMLDECYPTYETGCCTVYASRVLQELDPTAYSCGMDDWLDSEGLEVE